MRESVHLFILTDEGVGILTVMVFIEEYSDERLNTFWKMKTHSMSDHTVVLGLMFSV